MPALRPRRRSTFAVLALVVVTVVTAVAAPAAAQGTSGTLPDPISVAELDRYGLRLQLSPAQRSAVAMLHDAYKLEFRVLREGEIAELLRRMRGLQNGMLPDRDKVVEVLDDVTRLERKIAALDNHFLDRIGTVLDETQIASLPVVRDARTRRRLSASEMTWMGSGRPPDLGDIVLDLELDSETRDIVDATLRPFERRLTPKLRELSEASRNTMVAMFDALTERGFNQETMQDQQKMMEMMEAVQEVMREVSRSAMERTEAVWSLTSKTITAVSDRLPAAPRRDFRDTVLQRGYPQIAPAVRYPRGRLDRAIAFDGLTDEQREAVSALRDRIELEMERLGRDGREAMDAWRRDRDLFDMTGEQWRSRQEKAQSIAKRGDGLRERLTADLEAILGAELLARLDAAKPTGVGDGPDALASATTAPGAAEGGAAAATTDSEAFAIRSGLLPPKIGDTDVRRFADMMRLDPDRRDILLGLHQDYLDDFAAIEAGDLARVAELERALGGDGAAAAVDPLHAARRTAMATIRRTDEAFFDAVQATLFSGEAAAPLERVRWHRRRVSFQCGSAAAFGIRPSQEAQVDLDQLVRRQRLKSDAVGRIDATMFDWEHRAAGLLEQRWNVLVDAQRAVDQWSIELRRMQEEGSDWAAWSERYQQLVGDVQARAGETESAVEALNRSSLAAMVTALGDTDGGRLEDAYFRKSFPQVFTDETAAGDLLGRALALPELGTEQRGALADLAAEYGPGYRALCMKMVELHRSLETPWIGNDREAWARYAARQDELAVLTFERNEMNGRAIGRLRTVLRKDQLERLGPLPDLAAAGAGRWWE